MLGCGTASDARDDRYSTFTDACYTANIGRMKQQLRLNAKNKQTLINERTEDGYTPLHRAAQKGNPDVISFLIAHQADVTSVTKTGESPLHIACFHRKTAAVGRLLQTAAREHINVQDTQHGMTALQVAVSRGAADIVELLLKAGADPMSRDRYGNDVIELAKFWADQAEAGLASPVARYHQTLAVLKRYTKHESMWSDSTHSTP